MSRETMAAMMADVADAIKPKLIDRNTVQYTRADGATVVRFHHTDIIVRHPDGSRTLSSGGWKTMTTKERIGRYAPCNLYSDRGAWFVHHNGESVVPFYDGMILAADGMPVASQDAADALQDARVLKKRIGLFCKLVDTVDDLPTPNNGDCWFCSMFHAEKPTGELVFNSIAGQTGPADDTSHLLDHMSEGYLHGSLLVNAMRWAGYRDEGIRLRYGIAQRGDRNVFKRTLRRYLGRKLGLAIR